MSRQNNKVTRGPRGRWLPGESGNKGGRPKGAGEVRELARQHGPAAIARLAQLKDSKDEAVAVAACKVLLDRGYGKPEQSISTSGMPLVAITMNSGNPITDAADAARVYAEICGNPSLDITGLTFDPLAPAALDRVAVTVDDETPEDHPES